MIPIIDQDSVELVAQRFLAVSDSIGECDLIMRDLIRTGSSIKEEREAIEKFGFAMPDVIRALRAMAMRLDRNALGKYEDSLNP